MFTNLTIAILVAISATAWSYAKAQRQTGGNTTTAIISASVVGVLALIATWILLSVLA